MKRNRTTQNYRGREKARILEQSFGQICGEEREKRRGIDFKFEGYNEFLKI